MMNNETLAKEFYLRGNFDAGASDWRGDAAGVPG